MYHYDVQTALEELKEDALLPHPVRLRDRALLGVDPPEGGDQAAVKARGGR